MILPKISREKLEEIRSLFLSRRKNKENYGLIAKELGLVSIQNFTQFYIVVITHLSVQRCRIAIEEKGLQVGSKVTTKGRSAEIVKIRDFDEEVGLLPFGGCPVIIKFTDTGKTKRCGGTEVDDFVKVS